MLKLSSYSRQSSFSSARILSGYTLSENWTITSFPSFRALSIKSRSIFSGLFILFCGLIQWSLTENLAGLFLSLRTYYWAGNNDYLPVCQRLPKVFPNQRYIYSFAKEYLFSCFPKFPSYEVFNNRLNILCDAFKILFQRLISSSILEDCDFYIPLVDSFPIITCSGRNRVGKVAKELPYKGYCFTKISTTMNSTSMFWYLEDQREYLSLKVWF